MIKRRTLLGSSCAGAVLLAGGVPLAPITARSAGPAIAIIDGDIIPSAAALPVGLDAAAEILWFTSDLTRLWVNELEPRWREAPALTLGITSPAALDCLRLLARSYRIRPTAAATAGQAGALVWALTPLA